MFLPLEGIKVLSMAEQLPGPYCSMLLADLGADVTLLERPGTGDPARGIPHFLSVVNRNKKSVTVNLKTKQGKQICLNLAKKSDVFLEGFRPGVLTRLGIDYEKMKTVNPGIIYCSISGYGQTGPYRNRPGHDLSYQAAAGILGEAIEKGEPPEGPGVAVADLSSAMFACIGILSALRTRDIHNKGQYIDISMTDGLVSWMSVSLGIYLNTGEARRPVDKEPAYGVFQAKDGKYLTLSIAHEDYFWRNLCVAVGRDDLADMSGDERREKREDLIKILHKTIGEKPRDEWLEILSKADVPCGPASTVADVVSDPQITARKMIVDMIHNGQAIKQVAHPIKFSRSEPRLDAPSPKLGEHTREVLLSAGYSPQEIDAFYREGII